MPSFLDVLPGRNLCDFLFEAFVWNFHPVVPLVHIPTFTQEYEKFWESQSLRSLRAPHSIPLVLAALFAGCVVCSRDNLEMYLEDESPEDLATSLHSITCKALDMSHFPRVPTIESLSAYMIVQGTWMRDEEPLTSLSFVGITVRVAQLLGLHRDPSSFDTPILPIAAEIRRRVWWHVFHVDVIVASAAGLPPLIDRGSFDVHRVSTMSEVNFANPDIRQSPSPITNVANAQELAKQATPLGIFLSNKIRETS